MSSSQYILYIHYTVFNFIDRNGKEFLQVEKGGRIQTFEIAWAKNICF